MEVPAVENKKSRDVFIVAKASESDIVQLKKFSSISTFEPVKQWIEIVFGSCSQILIESEHGAIAVLPDGAAFVDYLDWIEAARTIHLKVIRQRHVFGVPQFVQKPTQNLPPKEQVVWFGRMPIPGDHIANEVSRSWGI